MKPPSCTLRGRITPACAGKSVILHGHRNAPEDHPRVCGEKELEDLGQIVYKGSPPRVRGKDIDIMKLDLSTWITPACAGKSRPRSVTSTSKRDHPRVCGEKAALAVAVSAEEGSPPRVRGNEIIEPVIVKAKRITPACAGKSRMARAVDLAQKDHPRVCGEK